MSLGEDGQSSEPGLKPYPDCSSTVGIGLNFSKKVVALCTLLRKYIFIIV